MTDLENDNNDSTVISIKHVGCNILVATVSVALLVVAVVPSLLCCHHLPCFHQYQTMIFLLVVVVGFSLLSRLIK